MENNTTEHTTTEQHVENQFTFDCQSCCVIKYMKNDTMAMSRMFTNFIPTIIDGAVSNCTFVCVFFFFKNFDRLFSTTSRMNFKFVNNLQLIYTLAIYTSYFWIFSLLRFGGLFEHMFGHWEHSHILCVHIWFGSTFKYRALLQRWLANYRSLS